LLGRVENAQVAVYLVVYLVVGLDRHQVRPQLPLPTASQPTMKLTIMAGALG
jgi:hypothetical protein